MNIHEAHSVIEVIQTCIGKYESVKVSFVSDTMLTGKVLKFNPGIYTDAIPTYLNDSFKILYPAVAGPYDFIKVNCKNHKAFITVVDAFNFTIEYRFFVCKNYNGYFPDTSYSNGTAFEGSSFLGKLGFAINIDGNYFVATKDIEITKFCDDEISFDDDGFIPGQDLEVSIETNSTVSNNYFVGLMKLDSISNAVDIIPGIVQNYAKVDRSINQVKDLPYSCFKDGRGFIQFGQRSRAMVTIDGSCLQVGSTYQIYVVFYQNGQWRSCKSGEINQASEKPGIEPLVTVLFTDEFGNESDKACNKGLAKSIKVSMCAIIDVADYDAKLTMAGYTGTFTDYLETVKAFKANGASSLTGTPLVMANTHPEYCVDDYIGDENCFVVIQFTMNFPGYKDIINVPFEIVYDANENDINVTVTDDEGTVNEMCEGGNYTLSQDFSECIVKHSINGGSYVNSGILTGTTINESIIPQDSTVCMKVICDNTNIETGDCVCPECTDEAITATIVQNTCSFGLLNGSITINSNNVEGLTVNIWDNNHIFNLFTAYVNSNSVNFNVELPEIYGWDKDILYETIIVQLKNGCIYQLSSPLIVHTEGDNPGDCEVSEEVTLDHDGLSEAECDCPEETVDCNNYASVSFICDPETQTIDIILDTSLESGVESESYLCSLDGGLTFIECPSSVTGESSIFVTYDASFSDRCESIHVEQVINCGKGVECGNSREIELEYSSGQLLITLTDSFTSEILSDKLFVSLDGGVSYTEYDPSSSYTSIDLEGDEKVVVYSDIVFEDECNDLHIIKTLDLTSETENEDCEGYSGYSLAATYNQATGKFTVTKSGDESDLLINELLFTLNGANPFDSQNSGVPYSDPIEGEGNLIARWKIKKPNCSSIILDAFCFGAKKTKVICVLNKSTGNEFIVTDIDLLKITDPSDDLEVLVNTTVQTYVSGDPLASGQYTITALGKLKFFIALSNATIKITQYPYL